MRRLGYRIARSGVRVTVKDAAIASGTVWALDPAAISVLHAPPEDRDDRIELRVYAAADGTVMAEWRAVRCIDSPSAPAAALAAARAYAEATASAPSCWTIRPAGSPPETIPQSLTKNAKAPPRRGLFASGSALRPTPQPATLDGARSGKRHALSAGGYGLTCGRRRSRASQTTPTSPADAKEAAFTVPNLPAFTTNAREAA
jgi:hypothetical protein